MEGSGRMRIVGVRIIRLRIIRLRIVEMKILGLKIMRLRNTRMTIVGGGFSGEGVDGWKRTNRARTAFDFKIAPQDISTERRALSLLLLPASCARSSKT